MGGAQIGEDLKAVVSGPSFLGASEWPFVPQGKRVALRSSGQASDPSFLRASEWLEKVKDNGRQGIRTQVSQGSISAARQHTEGAGGAEESAVAVAERVGVADH
jgi:hypothetical protein